MHQKNDRRISRSLINTVNSDLCSIPVPDVEVGRRVWEIRQTIETAFRCAQDLHRKPPEVPL